MDPFGKLMTADGFESMSPADALQHIGQLIERSTQLRRSEGFRRSLELIRALRPRLTGDLAHAALDFHEANVWAEVAEEYQAQEGASADWEHQAIEQQITCLRRAAQPALLRRMNPEVAAQILTNLGNALSFVGRIVEAIACWDQTLKHRPGFSMALGNRAMGLFRYALLLYDEAHREILLKRAHRDVTSLGPDVESHARPRFDEIRVRIEQLLSPDTLAASFSFGKVSLGRSRSERDYREWCLRKRLFLSPLNDVGKWAIAARDVLSTPSIVVGLREGPYFHGFYNQLKQDFVSARYLLYSGLTSQAVHFSDREVLLHDTLDYPAYCFSVEQVKCAYRVLYSLFD